MRNLCRTLFFFLVLVCLSLTVQAQKNPILSGYIKDAESGEDLIGASVMIADSLGMGTVTNVYGFYSINLPAGTYRVVYSYVGYESTEQTVDLSADTRVNINLKQQTVLQEVVITGERKDENISGTEMGTVTLGIEQVKSCSFRRNRYPQNPAAPSRSGRSRRGQLRFLCERRRTGSEPHLIRRSGGL